MSDIEISRSYTSDTERARSVVQKFLVAAEQGYGIKGTWTDEDNFTFDKAGHVEGGAVKIFPDKVTINMDLDFLGKMAKGMIESAINDEFKKIM